MLTVTQNKILDFLLRHIEEKVTIRGISKRLGKSYTLVYNNLENLEKKGIIRKEDVPPAKIISLNEYAPTNILIDIELKIKEEFLRRHRWVELLLNDILFTADNPFFIFMVFGSYAKEKQTKKSDIDLLVITQTKDQIKEMSAMLNKAYTNVKKNIVFADINDFKEMLSSPHSFNVGNEAKKCHVILYGAEQYYQIIKRAEKR